jgi:hypothetical protein
MTIKYIKSHKYVLQMAIHMPTFSIPSPLTICPNWNFWYENTSGNFDYGMSSCIYLFFEQPFNEGS